MEIKIFKKKPMKIEKVQEEHLKMIEQEAYIKEAIKLAKERGEIKAKENYRKNRR